MRSIIYLSYDGLLEPLGSSQVLEYVKILSKENFFYLITFEKPSDLSNRELYNNIKNSCNDHNIKWISFYYHPFSSPFKACFSLLNFFIKLFYLLASKKIDAIHLRGYFLGSFVLPLKFFFKFKFFFDTRGFWPDEKADRAGWKRSGLIYKAFKKLEYSLFDSADHIFFLTLHAIKLISKQYPQIDKKSSVIRTCANPDTFYPINDLKQSSFLHIGYLGTIDTAYNFKKIAAFISSAIKINKNLHITVMTRSNHNHIIKIFDDFDVPDQHYTIDFTRNANDLNRVINSFDVCIFYLNENYSIKASMPTKIGEVLACGVPIACNNFNDDLIDIFNSKCSILSDFDQPDTNTVLNKLMKFKMDSDTANSCLDIYIKYFSLEVGCSTYNSAYKIYL